MGTKLCGGRNADRETGKKWGSRATAWKKLLFCAVGSPKVISVQTREGAPGRLLYAGSFSTTHDAPVPASGSMDLAESDAFSLEPHGRHPFCKAFIGPNGPNGTRPHLGRRRLFAFGPCYPRTDIRPNRTILSWGAIPTGGHKTPSICRTDGPLGSGQDFSPPAMAR